MRRHPRGLGATAPAPTTDPLAGAQALESFMRASSPAIGRFAVWWNTLDRYALQRGVDLATLFPQAAVNRRTVTLARAWGEVMGLLDSGRAELVPYQRGNDPTIHYAVRMLDGTTGALGWWSTAYKVLKIGAGAVLTGVGYLMGDAYLETDKIRATAEKQEAETRAQVPDLMRQFPQASKELAQALQSADRRAAAASGGSWWDSFTGAVGSASTGALVALGVLWWLSSRSSGKSRPSRAPVYMERAATGAGLGAGGAIVGLLAALALSGSKS